MTVTVECDATFSERKQEGNNFFPAAHGGDRCCLGGSIRQYALHKVACTAIQVDLGRTAFVFTPL